jgi:hypothetical protein
MLYLLKSNGPSDALREKLQKASVITLKRGLQQMTESMEGLLKMAGNVTFKTETPVERIAVDPESQRIKVYALWLPSYFGKLTYSHSLQQQLLTPHKHTTK